MDDLRVPMGPILSAFGLAVTVTRPAPLNTPVPTTGVWLQSLNEERAVGTDFQRREPRRVLAVVRTAQLTHIPRGSIVTAPEQKGGSVKTWLVDSLADVVEVDHVRVVLVPAA